MSVSRESTSGRLKSVSGRNTVRLAVRAELVEELVRKSVTPDVALGHSAVCNTQIKAEQSCPRATAHFELENITPAKGGNLISIEYGWSIHGCSSVATPSPLLTLEPE